MSNKGSYIAKLYYTVETDDSVDYEQAAPLNETNGDLSFHLSESILTVVLKDGLYPNVKSARAVVDPILRAWEIDVSLRLGRGELSFIYRKADIVDVEDSEDGSRTVYLEHISLRTTASLSAEIHVGRSQYPSPPSNFAINPDIETLWYRYEGYLEGKEPLLAMSYFCLTLLEARAGRKNQRKKASKKYNISLAVLNTLGTLTSERRDGRFARKSGASLPLSQTEKIWIEETIKAFIRQLGVIEAGERPSQLTMADLPDLSQ